MQDGNILVQVRCYGLMENVSISDSFVFICLSDADGYCLSSGCGKERHLV